MTRPSFNTFEGRGLEDSGTGRSPRMDSKMADWRVSQKVHSGVQIVRIRNNCLQTERVGVKVSTT